MFIFLNGKFIKPAQAKISVFDYGFWFGDGVYETLRTYNGKIWLLNAHLDRLLHSAEMISLKIPWSKKQIGQWIKKAVDKNGFKESRIRITVTRGEIDLQKGLFSGLAKGDPTICILVQELKELDPMVYKEGVKVITFEAERIFAEAKTIILTPQLLAKMAAEKKGAFEALLVDRNGFVTEGASTNFYIVKNGVLITPKDNILAGTTRDLILKIVRKTCRVDLRNITLREIYRADECFISNAPFGIVPVAKVDGKKIGGLEVGEMTKKIIMDFKSQIVK